MGCDIHYFAERRKSGAWELLEGLSFHFGDNRQYQLFSALAGVRSRPGSPPQMAPRRGIPTDLSPGGIRLLLQCLEPEAGYQHCPADIVTFFQDDLSHHSHSWVLLQELIDYPWNQDEQSRIAGSQILSHSIPVLSQHGSPQDVRVVFWFDA